MPGSPPPPDTTRRVLGALIESTDGSGTHRVLQWGTGRLFAIPPDVVDAAVDLWTGDAEGLRRSRLAGRLTGLGILEQVSALEAPPRLLPGRRVHLRDLAAAPAEPLHLGDSVIGLREGGVPCWTCVVRRLAANVGVCGLNAVLHLPATPERDAAVLRDRLRSGAPGRLVAVEGDDGRPYDLRPVPMPDCDACWRHRPAPASFTVHHPVVGVVRKVTTRTAPGPEAELATAWGPTVGYLADGGGRVIVGAACATSRTDGRRRAVGELLERYAAATIDWSRMLRSRVADLPGPAVDVPRLVGFADEQYDEPGFPYHRFDPEAVHHWLPARPIAGGAAEDVWIPAQLVHLEPRSSFTEPPLDLRLSVGLAAGADRASAIRSGLLECLERHIACTAWHHARPIPQVPWEQLGDDVLRRCRHWREEKVTPRLHWASGPGGAVCVFAFLLDEGAGPAVSGGLACGFTPSALAAKALDEAAMVRANNLTAARDGRSAATFADDPRGLERIRDRSMLYAEPRMRPAVEAFLDARAVPVPRLPEPETREIGEKLAEDGHIAYWVDLTTPDVAAARHHVVRVVVPGLRPMDVLHRAPHLRESQAIGAYPAAPHPFA